MANSSWVCFECRLAVRRGNRHEGRVPCAQCGAACWPLGYKIRVPPRRDVRAWRRLRESQLARHHADAEAAGRAEVRTRHDLEREIRRLQAMPPSPGRTKAIRMLRKRLDGV